ncbi:hypothetical protein CPB86DRAFT_179257 [Serendipita vermifera]|nr:hypothetical protein CPB86DRAFT_179257 [Serendipita vermifera]
MKYRAERERMQQNDSDTAVQSSSDSPSSVKTEFDLPPAINVIHATPILPSFPIDPTNVGSKSTPAETLQAIAIRARERLAARVQAYWDQQQNVVHAATQVQTAYAARIESHLENIIQSMREKLMQDVEKAFSAREELNRQEFDSAIKQFREEYAQHHEADNGDALNKHQRLNSLEAQTRQLMDDISNSGHADSRTGETFGSAVTAMLIQLQEQADSLSKQYAEMDAALKEMQSVMTSAGLLHPRPLAGYPLTSSNTNNKLLSAVYDANKTALGEEEDKENMVFPFFPTSKEARVHDAKPVLRQRQDPLPALVPSSLSIPTVVDPAHELADCL